MPRTHKHFAAEHLGQLADEMISTALQAPKFNFLEQYFPRRSIGEAMGHLNESIENLRQQLGDDLCDELRQMSDQMHACFEADPDDTTGETRQGKDIGRQMAALVDARMLAQQAEGGE